MSGRDKGLSDEAGRSGWNGLFRGRSQGAFSFAFFEPGDDFAAAVADGGDGVEDVAAGNAEALLKIVDLESVIDGDELPIQDRGGVLCCHNYSRF